MELLRVAAAPEAAPAEQVPAHLSVVHCGTRLIHGNRQAPKGGRGLVLEHVRPRNILIGNMIERSEELTAGELIGYLNRFLAGAVITQQEDLMLTSAGVAYAPIDADDPDPWAHYRTAGLGPESFDAVDPG